MVHFEPLHKRSHAGYDKYVLPNWQMVPTGESRDVKLSKVAGCTAFNDSPEVAELEDRSDPRSSDTKVLRINGKKEGSGTIIAPHASGVAKLEYSVMDKQKVHMIFYFVEDGARHKPKRTLASVKPLLDKTNQILGPLANIWLEFSLMMWLPMAEDFGKVVCAPAVRSPDPTAEKMYKLLDESKAFEKYVAPSGFSVFCVSDVGHYLWECLEMRGRRARTFVAGVTSHFCLLDDSAQEMALAHEFGHWLALQHLDRTHPRPTDALMLSVPRGTYLTKHDVLTMRRSVAIRARR